MNRIYRLVFNHALGAWQAVAETARGSGQRGSSGRRRLPASVGVLVLAVPLAGWGASLPGGGEIVQGSGQIHLAGDTLTVQQHSQRLIADWQSFNIGAGQTVDFQQPGREAVALNRVLGNEGSTILGRLRADGQVFLINPHGVLFGDGAQVDVGGLVASTLSLSEEDFLRGDYRFRGDGGASVINRGRLNAADGGYVALLGGQVRNDGTIAARLGSMALAAGDAMTLDFAGDGLLNVTVDEGAVNALVENHQLLRADGGQVLMTARASDALMRDVVNNTGVVEARTLAQREGRILLLGGDSGTVRVAGKLDASAAAGNGGFVETSGARVQVEQGARVTTRAEQGDTGRWLIDPTDFTVSAGDAAQTGSGIGAGTLSDNLADNNIELATVAAGTAAGDIHVEAGVAWDADTTLTLSAHGDIYLNAAITATGEQAGLVLNHGGYAQNGVAAAGSDYHVRAPVTLSGEQASLQINGADYTLIRSMADLEQINAWGLNGHYALSRNLDASAKTYTNAVIGHSGSDFNGTFAGLGHVIENFTLNNSSAMYAGLFGRTGGAARVRDVGLVKGSVRARYGVGSLVSFNKGLLSNVYSQGVYVHAYDEVAGGLAAFNEGTISHAYSTGNVYGGANRSTQAAGGLAGRNSGTLRYVYATGNVTAGQNVGGLVGANGGAGAVVEYSWASGELTGAANYAIGGLVGSRVYNNGPVNSHWDMDSTRRNNVGGGSAASGTSGFNADARYDVAAYASLGDWQNLYGDVWIARDSQGTPQWAMIAGATRPFLYSEYSPVIQNAHQLQLSALDLSAHYTLGRHIDAAATDGANAAGMWGSAGFVPLGDMIHVFDGVLDGRYHTVRDLTIHSDAMMMTGLIGQLFMGGAVRNIGLENVDVRGVSAVGGLVGGNLMGEIENSYVTGSVQGQEMYAGLLAGYNGGYVRNAYAIGTVSGGMSVGGLIGANELSVENAYVQASVSGVEGVGMLFGDNAPHNDFVRDVFWVEGSAPGIGSGATGIDGAIALAAADLMHLDTFTQAGWDIDAQGGTGRTWRLYEGLSAPLLRGFLSPLRVSAADAKIYDGTAQGALADYHTDRPASGLLMGQLQYQLDSANVGTYTLAEGTMSLGGLYSSQLGYDIEFDGVSVAVTPKTLSLDNVQINDRVYDGTRDAAVAQWGALTGLVAGEDLTLDGSASQALFNTRHAGDGKTVTVSGVALQDGASGLASNYVLAPGITAQADIGRATLTVSATAQDRAYDGTAQAQVALSDDRLLGDSLTVQFSSAAFADRHADDNKTVTVSGITVTGADAGNYIWDTSVQTQASISKAVLDILAQAQDKTYDGGTGASVNFTDNRFNADELTITFDTATFADRHAGTDKTVTVGGIAVTGADAGNYTWQTDLQTQASIGKAVLNIIAQAQDKTYDGGTDASVSFTDNRFNADDLAVAFDTAAFADRHAGSGKTVTVSGVTVTGADAGNYTWQSSVQTQADIGKAVLNILAQAQDRTYDGTVAAQVNLSDNRVAGDTLNIAFDDAAFSDRHAGDGKTVTVSGLTITGADAGNYTWDSSVQTQASIGKAVLEIVAQAQDRTYDGTTAAQVSLTDNRIDGDALTFSFAADFADRHAGDNKTVTVRDIAISGADAGNYTWDDNVQTQASIDRAVLHLSAQVQGREYDGTTQALVTVSDDRFGQDDLQVQFGSAQYENADAAQHKSVTVSGISVTGEDADNYVWNDQLITSGNIDPRAIIVRAASGLLREQGAPWQWPAGAFVIEGGGLMGDDQIASVQFSSAGALPDALLGLYDISVSDAQGAGLHNYAIQYAGASDALRVFYPPVWSGRLWTDQAAATRWPAWQSGDVNLHITGDGIRLPADDDIL